MDNRTQSNRQTEAYGYYASYRTLCLGHYDSISVVTYFVLFLIGLALSCSPIDANRIGKEKHLSASLLLF